MFLEPVDVALQGKGDFAGVTQLRLLGWGMILDNPGGPKAILRILRKERQGCQSQRIRSRSHRDVCDHVL